MVHLGEGIGQLPRGVAVRGGFGLGGVHAWALRVERAAPKEGAQASARETAVMFPCSLLRLKPPTPRFEARNRDRKSTRLNSSHLVISYAVFCLKKKNNNDIDSLR